MTEQLGLRQLFDRDTSTYSYLVWDSASREAALIDPVFEQVERDAGIANELGLKLKYTIDTHVHADHITGSGKLRQLFGSESVSSANAAIGCASVQVTEDETLFLGDQPIKFIETPGHTDGCMTIQMGREGSEVAPMLFTGDTLLIRGCGRTDFQQGSSARLYASVTEKLFAFPEHTKVYPGHDYKGATSSTIGEERANNPRLKDGTSLRQFEKTMGELDLANPKYMDVALPANLNCGFAPPPQVDNAVPFAELSAVEVKPKLEEYRIVDVREADEFEGPLGHIDRAELVPLATVEAAARGWDKEQPILLVCRSGNRSGQACAALQALGFSNLTNLKGGMIGWNQL